MAVQLTSNDLYGYRTDDLLAWLHVGNDGPMAEGWRLIGGDGGGSLAELCPDCAARFI